MGSFGGHEPDFRHGEHGRGACARTAEGRTASRMANVNERIMVISFFMGLRERHSRSPQRGYVETVRLCGTACALKRGYEKGARVGDPSDSRSRLRHQGGNAASRPCGCDRSPSSCVAAPSGPPRAPMAYVQGLRRMGYGVRSLRRRMNSKAKASPYCARQVPTDSA